MAEDQGVTPQAGPGSRASHGAAKASPPKASIPNAEQLRAAFMAGWLTKHHTQAQPGDAFAIYLESLGGTA